MYPMLFFTDAVTLDTICPVLYTFITWIGYFYMSFLWQEGFREERSLSLPVLRDLPDLDLEKQLEWKHQEESPMTPKRIAGIILVVVALILLVFTIMSIGANMAKDGPTAGKITSYVPPYPNHGLYMVLTGFASVVSFLAGLALISLGKNK